MTLQNQKLLGPCALALALAGLVGWPGLAGPTAAAAPAPAKRALIVAIATYEPSTGWSPLGSGNDVPLIRDILSTHGFTDIQELRDAAATRQGILEAIRTRLTEPSAPGDVVVFHYSGHGQQLTDDADEEVDGYDETLVPWNAPMAPPPGYDGSKHLRDDEWGAQMDALRRKVGPSGHVLAFVDSCHSGSIPRGTLDQGVARVRGGAPPIGPPRPRT
ncbi:MAG TPA: caspase family protein, partial [Vicinamibacteria bacterium]